MNSCRMKIGIIGVMLLLLTLSRGASAQKYNVPLIVDSAGMTDTFMFAFAHLAPIPEVRFQIRCQRSRKDCHLLTEGGSYYIVEDVNGKDVKNVFVHGHMFYAVYQLITD